MDRNIPRLAAAIFSYYLLLLLLLLLCSLPKANARIGQNVRIFQEQNNIQDISCDDLPPADFELDREIVDKSLLAAELSDLTYQAQQTDKQLFSSHFEFIYEFEDKDDGALVAYHPDSQTCYAAFSPTERFNLLDIWQLFNPKQQEIEGCTVRKGYYNAYFSTYYFEFLEVLEDCMSKNDGETKLVLTGHSQGGSNALVAAVDLKRYDPLVITFGSLRTFVSKCDNTILNTSRVYRFTNVGNRWYDEWVHAFQQCGVHVGHHIMLDSASSSPGVYLGLDENETRNPKTRDVHEPRLYWDALDYLALHAQVCPGPVRLRGWEEGHWCTLDDECNGTSICISGYCRVCENDSCIGIGQKISGESCANNEECKSGLCEKKGLLGWRGSECV